MESIFSIDVEDWYHILEVESSPNLETWTSMPSRLERNFIRMLDIFSRYNVHTTCFFLGWVGEKYPNLVREAFSRKHEIASHGYAHQLITGQSKNEFYEDVYKTKGILEDITGDAVTGYRAPGFSITPQTKWAFDVLAQAGYKYGSSLFPAVRAHGYFLESSLSPFKIQHLNFYEFPLSVTEIFSRRICFFGGGYFRLFPTSLILNQSHRILGENRPVIYYIHPREIDVNQPRLKMNFKRRFKSYVNLHLTSKKIERIISEYDFLTYKNFLNKYHAKLESVKL